MNRYIPDVWRILQNTSVDFGGLRSVAEQIHLVQYDRELPIVAVQLFIEGKRLEVSSSDTVKVRWKNPDGTVVYKDVLGYGVDPSIVYFNLNASMTMRPGNILSVLELIRSNTTASSSPMNIVIETNPIQDGDIEAQYDPPFATVAYTGNYNDLTNKLSAGTNITIDANNVISCNAEGIVYYAGQGINITNSTISITNAIYQGATKGNTAVQPNELGRAAFTNNYNDLDNKPTFPTLSEVAYTGSYNDLANKLVAGTNVTIDANNVISFNGGGGGSTYVAGEGIEITNYTISVIASVRQGAAKGMTAVQPGQLGAVAFSNDYNDLTNKPPGNALSVEFVDEGND